MGYLQFRPLRVLVVCALLFEVSVVWAAEELPTVIVTGTSLPGVQSDTVGPLQVITRAQIERSGAASLAELLKNVAAASAGGADESAVLGFAPGVSAISLRGLGTGATLILLDGRRVAPSGFVPDGQTSATNLNAIPLGAIARVEIMLDGASAVYGSDAVGGVVNIITRRPARESVVRASAGQASSYGDGTRKSAAVTLGFTLPAGDGSGGIVSIERTEQDRVRASARPRTATGNFSGITGNDWRSTYAYPGNLYTIGGADGGGETLLGPLGGCQAAVAGAPFAGNCVYDPVRHQDLQPRTRRDAVYGAGNLSIGGGLEVFANLLGTRSRLDQESPTYSTDLYHQFFRSTPGAAITLPVGHPQNPYPFPVALRHRWADRPFSTHVESLDTRAVIGVRGSVAKWTSEAAVLMARSDATVSRGGLIRDRVLYSDVLDPARNFDARPSFVFGSPADNPADVMGRLYPTLVSRGKTSIRGVDLKASREIGELAGGPLALVVGAEWRRESFSSIPDPLQAAGEISVSGSYSADGARNVGAVFAEVSAPLTKGLDALLALRADRYEGFGVTTTPRIGLRWQASPTLAVRASHAGGFRAPSIGELTQAPTQGFYGGVRDPVLCPDPSDASNAYCSTFVLASLARGQDLRPERSENVSAGLIFAAAPHLSMSMDFYKIRRRDQIASFDPNYVLANEASFPGLVTRDPLTNEIVSMTLPLTNIGVTRLWGYDLGVSSRVAVTDMGSLTLASNYNRQPSYRVTPVPGAAPEQRAGYYLQPKARLSFSATWERSQWTLHAGVNHVGSYLRSTGPSDAACPYATTAFSSLCRISSWTTADVSAAYRPAPGIELSLSIKNVANRQPPTDERLNAFIYTLYNPSYHNALGRFLTASVKASF